MARAQGFGPEVPVQFRPVLSIKIGVGVASCGELVLPYRVSDCCAVLLLLRCAVAVSCCCCVVLLLWRAQAVAADARSSYRTGLETAARPA
ncbi:hypothetical protein PR002_g15209 [Phytophthora rubi]|uniref:Uncharacterized protein n=1 Tax=Phytophthora rubi TaxID=129364 RepID=A0A6A3KVS3_9STRA|nr:hypothetical protein PR002_g15209 [Phytophthora rubi]